MRFRKLMLLVEEQTTTIKVWQNYSRDIAKKILESGLDKEMTEDGPYGHALYFFVSPSAAEHDLADDTNETQIILEFHLDEAAEIIDLDEKPDVLQRYHGALDDPNISQMMIERGIDGVISDDAVCIYDYESVRFYRVWSGVVTDPLDDISNSLDEFALGGLMRCTAVTVNALLKHFAKPGIQLSQVPENQPGVLAILDQKGLSYRPDMTGVGRTLQQFSALHQTGAFYLVTPGHALALIDGELFDAENLGPNGRKIMQAFQIARR